MDLEPKCDLVDASKAYSGIEVLRIHYDVTSADLLTIDLDSISHGEFQLRFESPEGVRVLDEGQLCEFWKTYSGPSGWLWQVLDGGWLTLEQQRDHFWLPELKPHNQLLEFLVVADQCVSILTRNPPTFPFESSSAGSVV